MKWNTCITISIFSVNRWFFILGKRGVQLFLLLFFFFYLVFIARLTQFEVRGTCLEYKKNPPKPVHLTGSRISHSPHRFLVAFGDWQPGSIQVQLPSISAVSFHFISFQFVSFTSFCAIFMHTCRPPNPLCHTI